MKLLTLLGIFFLATVSEAQTPTVVAGSKLWFSPYNNVSYSITHQLLGSDYGEGFMPHGSGLYESLTLATNSTTEVWGHLVGIGDYNLTHAEIGMVAAIHSYDYCYQYGATYGSCLRDVVQAFGTQKNYSMYYNYTQPIHDIGLQITAVNSTIFTPTCSFSPNSTLPSWNSNGWSFQVNHSTCALMAMAPTYTSIVHLSVHANGAMTHFLTNMTFSTTGERVIVKTSGGGALFIAAFLAFGINRLSSTK
jgi:hypothetical protein